MPTCWCRRAVRSTGNSHVLFATAGNARLRTAAFAAGESQQQRPARCGARRRARSELLSSPSSLTAVRRQRCAVQGQACSAVPATSQRLTLTPAGTCAGASAKINGAGRLRRGLFSSSRHGGRRGWTAAAPAVQLGTARSRRRSDVAQFTVSARASGSPRKQPAE